MNDCMRCKDLERELESLRGSIQNAHRLLDDAVKQGADLAMVGMVRQALFLGPYIQTATELKLATAEAEVKRLAASAAALGG